MPILTRRRLLAAATTATAAAATAYWLRARYHVPDLSGAWGALRPVADETSGVELLRLPDGFRYASFGWSGQPMSDGVPTPCSHDGMAVVRTDGGIATLVRNHEIDAGTPFGTQVYDSGRGGGTTTLRFDLAAGRWLDSHASLTGTSRNCAGGPTPWGTWLTCEETVEDAGGQDPSATHGWVFEVDPNSPHAPRRLPALGRFRHEAAAVDPSSGIVYLTEDLTEYGQASGFYRLLPTVAGDLTQGGRLQMLAVDGAPRANLEGAVAPGEALPAAWVDIADPERAHWQGRDGSGVVTQGLTAGGARFRRLEGCWFEDGLVYFTSTSGGAAGAGQIWQYTPATERLRMVYASPGRSVLDSPDNLVARGKDFLLLCEDGSQPASRLIALTTDGVAQPFAQNTIYLRGEHGISGNYQRAEWTGAAFAGDWLFVNAQKPGITFAITGPWGALGSAAA